MIENSESTERIIRVNIEEEMKSSYIDYSMSVIVSRALPDVRDGLKPVHRRILFGMSELGLTAGKPYKKSARIVGDVMGKYHPHGDTALYDAMVRMAQEWSLRYLLVDGQGNYGSVDGDQPAAMRYTEARLQKMSEEVLADLDKNTVDFRPNYSEEYMEPSVLATKVPLLLINGASGIAVGMATNMAPHNLTEICNAICAYIDNKDITIEDLMQYVKAPDFPTGATIYGIQGIKEAYETGRGRVVLRSKTDVETSSSGRETIVISEIPYQVNKKELIEKIAALVEEKKVEGIAFVNDESDRNGMRIVVKLKQGAVANVVLNNLFKYTALQSTFSINNIALVDGRPCLLNLRQLIKYFVRHRHEVVLRRTRYELEQAEKRAHILEGLLIALDHLDAVIALIRASKTPEEARIGLMSQFGLSEIQANAIIEMRLRQLTGLERDKIKNEYAELQKLIAELSRILADETLQFQIIKDETIAVRDKYGDERRTDIVLAAGEFNPEDFYADEDMVITISHMGYIKRTSLQEYRLQNRGGVGAKGSNTRDEDFLEHIYVANMHSTMLFFTQKGRCYWLKVYEVPEGTKASKGRAIQNVINIEPDDKVCAYINVRTLSQADYINNNYIVLCTKRGTVKKTSLEAYSRPRANGVNAITVREGDELLEAVLTNGNCEILLAARAGKCVRFNEEKVRAIGRTGAGVRGINIEDHNEVIGMVCVDPNSPDKDKINIMVVSENGYGKRSDLDDYRVTNRGGKGVRTINVTEKTGQLIAIKDVMDDSDLMIINKSGLTIRLAVSEIRITGRVTQGVKLINLKGKDSIAAVCKVSKSEEENGEETTTQTEEIVEL
ncbi:MAG: DNA gyrase subunit A [Bacteroidales bacterium]|nr:DNA gyrase subunit A [Bacteroidales bacterium]MCL2133755.1 DNA gyrase subunit A [Bacteroidales bacterium]